MFVKVRVHTGKRKEQLEKFTEMRYTISVRERPERNAANRRVIEMLASELCVPAKNIRFVSGQRSPSKLFEILPARDGFA